MTYMYVFIYVCIDMYYIYDINVYTYTLICIFFEKQHIFYLPFFLSHTKIAYISARMSPDIVEKSKNHLKQELSINKKDGMIT